VAARLTAAVGAGLGATITPELLLELELEELELLLDELDVLLEELELLLELLDELGLLGGLSEEPPPELHAAKLALSRMAEHKALGVSPIVITDDRQTRKY
jgi:hypothetical protein